MRRDKPKRHDPEKVKQALALLQTGKSLSDVARHFDVSKSLLSYWRNHAGQADVKQDRLPARKANERTRRFIERCWGTIRLAFKKLDGELGRDKPMGVRDLALCIAVLRDKLSQAEQNLHAKAAPSSSGFTVSEDTWLILKRHRESQVAATPAENPVGENLGGPGLEPQKVGEGGAVIPAEIIPPEPGSDGASTPPARLGRP